MDSDIDSALNNVSIWELISPSGDSVSSLIK